MLTLCVLAMAVVSATPETALHDFQDLSVWSGNRDGGNPPAVSEDAEFAREGTALRLHYTNRPPDWGNLTGPCSVPGEALALTFWVYVHSAADKAALHIWLMEPDNDAWVQRVRFAEGELKALKPEWCQARLPVSGFTFEPRGAKTRQMTTVNRMLIGCNYGDLEVTIDSMTWETESELRALPLPRTEGLEIERGELGSVGVLDMGGGLKTAHAPAALAERVRYRHYGATILLPGDLADPDVLTAGSFDAVILPFGPYFPAEARDTFLAYLKAGGSFLSTDGYAFDQLVYWTADGWTTAPVGKTAAEMDSAEETEPLRMNTRFGKPGDAVTFEPRQIGVFDPQFPLEHAVELREVGGPWPGSTVARFEQPLTGFSACCLTGVNSPVFPPVHRRWVPILQAYDGAGGLRGTALAVAHNFAGEYPRSSWAFSGVTSGQDLLLGDKTRNFLLERVLGAITRKCFLHSLTTDLACYERGETARLSVQVTNNGRRPLQETCVLYSGRRTLYTETVSLQPGGTRTVSTEVRVADFDADLVTFGALLDPSKEGPLDRIESAFCIRDPQVLASGAKLGWRDNYLTVDGKASFLVGTNQTGMMYFSPDETPATWDRDFANMAAHGFHLWRILHFSPFAARGYEGQGGHSSLDLRNRPEKLVRQMDAIVQLAQKHRVAIFLALHDWLEIALTDEELAAQADWNRFWAERYKDVPGVLYDIQNEPSVPTPDRPDIVALWNAFLQQRYESDEALRAAWAQNPPEAPLPNVPLGSVSDDWEDARSADRKRFETELLNRWVKANVDGIRAGDADALVCVGYLPSMPPADKILGVRHTDFSNVHYYGPVERFPMEFGIIDRRFQGKGFSLGECGAQEAHDARVQGSFEVPVKPSVQRFRTYTHYAAAMGATFVANWDWKEFDESVFPWGLFQRNTPVARPWLHTWEQDALLLSLCEPRYESPGLFLVAPDRNRIGPRFSELNAALLRAFELLLDQRVDFGMVNEEDLEGLPASAKALVWPVPYCPSDETFDRLLAWVQAGGTLYLSGDVSFDPSRRPSRASRRPQLSLPAAAAVPPFATPDGTWSQEPLETSIGQGKVLYVPYPLELRARPGDAAIYARFIELAGLKRVEVSPTDAPVRARSIPTKDGRLYMLARASSDGSSPSVTVAGVTLDLAPDGLAFVLTGAQGRVLAAESQGGLRLGGAEFARAEGHFAVCALDGNDLRESGMVLVLPHQCATVNLPGLSDKALSCRIAEPAAKAGDGSAFTGAVTFAPPGTGRVAVLAPAKRMPDAVQAVHDLLARR